MRRPTRLCWIALLAVLLPACHEAPPTRGDLTASAAAPAPQTARPDAPVRVQPGSGALLDDQDDAGEVVVAVLEPAVLSRLDAGGFSLSRLVTGVDARTTAELAAAAPLDDVFEVLVDDLEEVAADNPKARVSSHEGRRLFDAQWLAAPQMSFELIGVFNRLDRRVFAPDTCGEVRFVYRLRYETEQGGAPMRGRLPMTINVVFWIASEGDAPCRAAAAAWQKPAALSTQDWLTASAGPLGPAMRERWRLKAVESSLQTIRWQSTVHPSLAGHVEYLLRVFEPDGERLVPAPLENTPDVAALRKSASLRKALAELLRQPETLAALDQGTLVLPSRFLATRALATSPRGLSRDANRPFRQLFEPDEAFGDLELSRLSTIKSPAALVRRLDGLTCMGCHQSHSVGGFHHLGREDGAAPFGSLLTGSSVHLTADLARRETWMRALLEPGATPDEHRPSAERQGMGGGHGAPCGLGDPGFAGWTCDEGFTCTEIEDKEVGACTVAGAPGSACEYGTMRSRARPHKDRVKSLTEHGCGEYGSCLSNEIGWAQGACTTGCEPGDAGCGAVADIDGIQKCLRKGGSLSECSVDADWLTALQPCDENTPCRQDYVCVANDRESGSCVPPYFVYQLRLDGYPIE